MQTRSLESETIRLVGPLFVPDTFAAFLKGDLDKTFPVAIPEGTRLNAEIDRSWDIASGAWRRFQAHREARPQAAIRAFLLSFFRDALGYPIPADPDAKASLSFRFPLLPPSVPVFFKWYPQSPAETLDSSERRFSGDGLPERRRSLANFVQQWLNLHDDALWAIATDGCTLRLFRDNASLTRPAYVEADLSRIFSEGRRTDFGGLFRLLFRDRSGTAGDGHDSIWEKLRAKSAEDGVRVFNDLRDGVVKALHCLGDGFLKDRSIRDAFTSGALTPESFSHELLRTAYRFLFLFAAEERNALHLPKPDPGTAPAEAAAHHAARSAYAQGYSMRRLADRCRRASARDSYADVWEGVRIVFRSLAHGEPRLALPALGGIFRTDQTPHLDAATIANRDLLEAIRALRWFERGGSIQRVNYHNMGVEELGSVYESLLELVPSVSLTDWRFSFVGIPDPRETAATPRRRGRRGAAAAGNARKLTGSYYTPSSLVVELVNSTLSDDFFAKRLKGFKTPGEREAALLSLSVLDPACGSGHFLLAAANRIAKWLVQVRSEETPADPVVALRDVVTRCIYGTDLNPMAVELAKIALWLETLVPGQPLSFLDAHFAVGNSVLGISSLDQLAKGISADAFDELPGDVPTVVSALKTANTETLKYLCNNPGPASLFAQPDDSLAQQRAAIDALPGSTLSEIDAKAAAWVAFRDQLATHRLFQAADYYVAAFLLHRTDPGAEYPVTALLLGLLASDPNTAPSPEALAEATRAARAAQALHWPLVFPEVFARGGFDAILGNPPWDRVKLQAKEFFATRFPAIANAPNAATRNKLIKALATGSYAERRLHVAYEAALSSAVRLSVFVHARRPQTKTETSKDKRPSARFPLTGTGDVNLYALFAELALQLLTPDGRAGIVLPTGICTDNSTQAFFNHLASSSRIVSIHDFENREGLFPAVDSRFKFCLLAIGPSPQADLAFFLTNTSQLSDERRHFTLTPDDFVLLNPNTRTCPVCRTKRDLELLKQILGRIPPLLREGSPDGNLWGIEYKRLFDMANDSRLFLLEPDKNVLPLYEAKMINHFDHRWATFDPDAVAQSSSSTDEDDATGDSDFGNGGRPPTLDEKANPGFEPRPRYWIPSRLVYARLADVPEALSAAAKKWDLSAMRTALANWAFRAFPTTALGHDRIIATLFGQPFLDSLPHNWFKAKFSTHCRIPLSLDELQNTEAPDFFEKFFKNRSPQWMVGWRKITNATNRRTLVCSVMPAVAAGDSLQIRRTNVSPQLDACLLAEESSLVVDWISRCKLGGVNFNYFAFNQLPALPPSAYNPDDIDYIVSRVLELTYTSHSLAPWARALGHDGPPFPWNEDRRAILRAELDARFARLYGLTRDDLLYILDPKAVMGDDFPSESFFVLQKNERRDYGEYRTARLVLEAWQEQELAETGTYVREAEPFAEADTRKDYLKFLIRQMLRDTYSETLSLSDLYSAWAALSDPHRMAANKDMPAITKAWAAQFKDAIRDDDNLEDLLVGMCADKQISISKDGMVSLRRFPLDESLSEVRDITMDARLALLYSRKMRATGESVRCKLSDAFVERMEAGAFEYDVAA